MNRRISAVAAAEFLVSSLARADEKKDRSITGGGQSVTFSRSKFGTGLEAVLFFLRVYA